MKKLMSTLQRWGVLGLGVLGGHGATASQAHFSDEALNHTFKPSLPLLGLWYLDLFSARGYTVHPNGQQCQ